MKSHSNPLLHVSAIVAALTISAEAATDITIVNPSFETGNIAGWGGGPDTGALNYTPALATSGSWVGYEGNFSGATYMYQDLPNVPSSSAYTFTIDLGVWWSATNTNNGPVTVGLEKTGALVNTTVVPVDTLTNTAAQTWSVTLVNDGSIAPGDTLRIYVDKGAQTTGGGDYLVTLDTAKLQAVARDLNWTNAAANMTWSSTDDNWSEGPGWEYSADNAFFGAAGVGEVNLAENLGVHNITFDSAGYTITGSTLRLYNSTITANADATISSSFVGGSSLIKAGNGTLTLTGPNGYTGNTTINAGTLKIAEGASIYNGGFNNTSVLTVNDGATLELNRWGYGPGAANQSLGGLDYNPARFVINGGTVKYTGGAAGAPTDPAESPYGPGFTIGALGATLDAATAGDTWTVKFDDRGYGPIASNEGGTLTLTGVGNGVFDKELGGTGGVVKNGTGTWELNRTNTYDGNTVVNDGALNVTSTGSLRFSPTSNATTNAVSGSATGTLSFLGTVDLDLGAANTTGGNLWNLFDLDSFTVAPSLSGTTGVSSNLGAFTEVSAGTWELPVTGAKWVFTEADGNLAYVVTATDYDNWELANGVSGTETDDDDADGLSNFEEYAFGLDPTGGSSVNPITVQLNKAAKSFSYQRRDNGLTGLTYTVWFSTDLSTWSQDTGASQPDGTPDGNGVETINVTLSVLPGDPLPAKLFVQVRAN
jgi:autotransporter-associated beta strand protein